MPLLLGSFLAVTLTGTQTSPGASLSIPAQSDEFAGPFASWDDVKLQYGAVGDGTADDTAAIQNALNDLGTPGHSPVLFFPNGTYRVTRTLSLAFTINVSLVGEDPARTTIVWDGPAVGTMLSINGVAYSRFVRLTFDGRRRASVAIEQSWDGSRPHFDTGNEYADDSFVDVEYGIHGGFKGHGFAETSIVRSHFVRNTGAGVALGNFNALDAWVWYSTFDHCNVGVTNGTGAGNFHVYGSVFRHSTTADLFMGNTGGFSARNNYSLNSQAFFVSSGNTNNPATIHLQGNTILDPADVGVIRLGNQGPGLLVDNVIRSLPAAVGPAVNWASFIGADVASIGNTFTVDDPVTSNGRLISVDNRVVPRHTLNPTEPVLPGTLPNFRRQVTDLTPGADDTTIQKAIDAAAAHSGTRPIVHIPNGVHTISKTLTVPPSDIQIVGDGYGTILRWAGTGTGPVMRIAGPSQATLREIQIDGAMRADGIIVEDADQVRSRVYMQQVQLRAGLQTDLSIDELDHTYVQLEDVGYAYSPNGVAITVTGGPLSAAGQTTAGKTNVFSGASAGKRVSYDVSRGAKVLVRDLWYESGAGPGFANIHGRAQFTADGLRVSSPINQLPAAFNISDLDGKVAILAADIDDRITIGGTGSSAKVLGMAVYCHQPVADCFVNTTSPPADTAFLNSRQISPVIYTRSIRADDVGTESSAFIRTMLAHTRAEAPAMLHSLPAGVTDVRMFRVWVANGVHNVTLTAR